MNASKKKALKSLLEDDPDILFAYLFGSQVSGLVTPMSDLDVAVYARSFVNPKVLLDLQSEIMERVHMSRIDLLDLRRAPPLLAYEVVSSGKLLFTRDVDAQNRFERRTFLHYFDTQHLRDVQNQYLRDRLKAS